jgi:acyl-CoA thioester hydrolase
MILMPFGHVNNASLLNLYAQEARSNFTWYSRKAAGLEPLLLYMVVARAEVDFIEPIYNGGFDLDVAIWVSKIGNSSFELAYEFTSEARITCPLPNCAGYRLNGN